MSHDYTEDQLVEQPAIGLFAELGWTIACGNPHPGPLPGGEGVSGVGLLPSTTGRGAGGEGAALVSPLLGRETTSEVVLKPRLEAALRRLNPGLPPEAITAAVDELIRDRSAMSLEAANREVYLLLKDGIKVPVLDSELGGQKTERLRVVDWENPANNDFLLVSQFSITGALYTCRPDLVGFVNGLPLIVTELKKPGVPARAAFDENLSHYKQQIPALFWYNAMLIASNGTESRVGSLTADWDRFFEWKRIESEDEPARVSLEVMIRGTCDKSRFLDLVENFTLFSEHKAGLVKIIGQNHQVLGVNALVRSLLRIRGDLTNPATLTPTPLPEVEGQSLRDPHPSPLPKGEGQFRGGLHFSGLVERARELRQKQTPAEDIAWELLRDRRFEGLKFRRQHQIGNYIADFCCAEHKLCIEVDGDVHLSPEVEAKDAQRDAYLRSLGYTILRFQNQSVIDHPEEFLSKIAAALPLPSTKLSAPSPVRSGHPLPLGEGRGEGNTPSPNGIGVFWQTQGSGKSFSMVFFAQKVLRKLAGNWTFVVVTDRVDLDDQIATTFKACGAVSEAEGDQCHAESGAHLRELLRGNHRYVFTLIHKFRPETPSPGPAGHPLPEVEGKPDSLPSTSGRGAGGEGQPTLMEVLCERRDIIALVDESHRSQYDTLAMNMRAAIPRALFVAFTGTPLIAGEERTKDVFGDYVSIYDFQQSVEDGATVPLFYENRTPELQLVNPDLNEDIYNLIEEAELDPEQEAKLERELGRQYHILTRDDRLDTVAKDIVRHFLGRGFIGKAMVVSIDKATALKMHDKVRKYWMAERKRVEKEIARLDAIKRARTDEELAELAELKARLDTLITTDMSVVVSPAQNEIPQMKKLGLDIEPHRKRMNDEELDEKFKDSDDPLRLVFVCAMWLTGFDAPSCSTIYLDKPMRNHTLMQTIARANRVFPGKHCGMIVDYANVFASLEKALAIYGAGKGGQNPVKDKTKLVEDLRRSVEAATVFCMSRGVELAEIEAMPTGLDRLTAVSAAVNAIISPDPLRREFFGHERLVTTLYRAVKPDPAAIEFSARVACICAIADAIRAVLATGPVDISVVMEGIGRVLDKSITGVEMPTKPAPVMDLSKIDFEALKKRFKESPQKNTDLEALKAAIRAQLEKLIQLNKTRADFREKFEKLIESYNAGSRSIEDLFEELLALGRALSEEQQRHVRENMSEEELVIFDILTRPAPELSTEERNEIKKVAHELLTRLKELLVLDWRQRAAARSQVRLTIEDVLDTGLPRAYTPEVYQTKCSAVFEHVYESYSERNAGTYA